MNLVFMQSNLLLVTIKPGMGTKLGMAEMKQFEAVLRYELDDDSVSYIQDVSGGIVNRAAMFVSHKTEEKYFVKYHEKEPEKGEAMFSTEKFSLDLLSKTKIVHVPKSIKVVPLNQHGKVGALHVLEHIADLRPMQDFWSQLGEQIARLHSLNSLLLKKSSTQDQSVHHKASEINAVDKFGSSVPHFIGTFCPRVGWRDTWEEYFLGDILNPLFGGLEEKYSDRSVIEKWSGMKFSLHKVFQGANILPDINHGDLCPANFGQTPQGPVVFDPSVDYAHHEFDMILSKTEGGFHDDFFTSYNKMLPQAPGWEEREAVYKLFYNVVMWYHVADDQFRDSTITSLDNVSTMLQQLSVKS